MEHTHCAFGVTRKREDKSGVIIPEVGERREEEEEEEEATHQPF